MKILGLLLHLVWLLILATPVCRAQSDPIQQIIQLSDQFQNHQATNVDSAFYAAERLTALQPALLNDLLHIGFVQEFTETDRDRTIPVQLLRRMAVGSPALRTAVAPLYQWVSVRDSLNQPDRVNRAVTAFLNIQQKSRLERGNRLDRYALLLYDALTAQPRYSALADTLFARTQHRLMNAVSNEFYQADGLRAHDEARAYFRYLMAYAQYRKAQEALRGPNRQQAASLLKEASQYSADDTDRQYQAAYFYETVLLSGGALKSFHRAYTDYLLTAGDTATAIQVLTELALADPGNLDILKEFYARKPVQNLPFKAYWTQMLNAKLKPAEPFQLVLLDRKRVNYDQLEGKWILIDFWGTWCKPCVAELPRFQRFYSTFKASQRQDLMVLTAACHDTEPRVRAFLEQQKYTFPVAMVDEAFIRQFRVGEYPTKVLITPQGNRMKIPFNTNWEERINLYTAN